MKGVQVLTILFLLTISTSQLEGKEQENVKKVRLSVYYETLCPDSKKFIKTQLTPLLTSHIGKYLNVDLVPYGKATTSTGSNGDYKFSCQHGDDECRGNKIHACTLKYLPKKDAHNVIGCSMSHRYPPGQVESCMKDLGLEFSPVETCSKNSEGSELLATHGRSTHSLEPRLYFVPWIVFDRVWSEEIMERSLQNLRSVVCEKIGQELCEESSDSAEYSNNKENRGSRRV